MSEPTAEEQAKDILWAWYDRGDENIPFPSSLVGPIAQAIRGAEEHGKMKEWRRVSGAIREAEKRGMLRAAEIAREAVALTPPSGWTDGAKASYETGCDDMSLSIAEAITEAAEGMEKNDD